MLYRQHPLMWQHPPRTLQTKNSFFHPKWWLRWDQNANPRTKGAVSKDSVRMGSQWEMSNNYQRNQISKKSWKTDRKTTFHSVNGIRAKARTQLDQAVDSFLKTLKLKIPGELHDEVLLTTNNKQAIWALQSKWKTYRPQKWSTIPNRLWKNW